MIYRKCGSSARWENGNVVRVVECGVAVEDDDRFTCEPAAGEALAAIDPEPVIDAAARIREAAADVAVERLIVTEGIAEHECGGRRWRETSRRMHLSLVRGAMRALIDTASFDVSDVARIAGALARCEAAERPAPPLLRCAPNVTAALLPSLVGVAPPNVRLLQTAGGTDGNGNEIVETEGEWPNWYRPSYRVRPVRAPHNLRLECSVTQIDRDRPLAVALLAPPAGLVLRVLIDDGERVYPATARVTRIDAVAAERVWYPYGAGSFGAEMML